MVMLVKNIIIDNPDKIKKITEYVENPDFIKATKKAFSNISQMTEDDEMFIVSMAIGYAIKRLNALITPVPPTAIIGNVKESSPERMLKSSSRPS